MCHCVPHFLVSLTPIFHPANAHCCYLPFPTRDAYKLPMARSPRIKSSSIPGLWLSFKGIFSKTVKKVCENLCPSLSHRGISKIILRFNFFFLYQIHPHLENLSFLRFTCCLLSGMCLEVLSTLSL